MPFAINILVKVSTSDNLPVPIKVSSLDLHTNILFQQHYYCADEKGLRL